MTQQIKTFWTNEQFEKLTERAHDLGLANAYELVTLLGLRALGVEFKPTPKGRRKAIGSQTAITQEEYQARGSSTVNRIRKILSEAGEPMTVEQIREGLGWKAAYGISGIMNENFVKKGLVKKTGPGRRATLWGLE